MAKELKTKIEPDPTTGKNRKKTIVVEVVEPKKREDAVPEPKPKVSSEPTVPIRRGSSAETEVAKKAVKLKLTAEQVLAVMSPKETYSSTDLLKKLGLGLNFRHALNKIMEKLSEEKKVTVTIKQSEGSERKRFVYSLLTV
jgi:hypothetical protein